jgi:hypothetical protein
MTTRDTLSGFVAILSVIGLLASAASAQPKPVQKVAQTCPPPLTACPAGSNGGGGCYDVSKFTCNAGKMCQISNPKVCTN